MADIAVLGLRVDSTGAVTATQKLADELNKLGAGAVKTERSLASMATGLVSLAAVGATLRKAIGDAQAFEAQLALVSTVADSATASTAVFSKQLLQTFRDLPVGSMAELTKGLYDIISAGVPAGKAMEFLNVAARGAIAGVTDTATAVDALTSVVNAYRTTQLDVNVASDQFFKAIQLGKTTFPELAASIGKAAPVAAAFGVSLADVLAATAKLTAGGIGTAESITGIRAAITAIIQPTGEFAAQFPKLAAEFNATKLESAGLVGFLREFSEATNGSKDAINALFREVSGKTAVLALLADGGVGAADALRQIQEAGGAAGDAFDKATATSSALNQQLRNQLGAAFTEVGLKLLPAVNGVLGTLVDAMDALRTNLPLVAAGLATAAGAAAAYAVASRAAATVSVIMGAAKTVKGIVDLAKALRAAATAAALLNAAKGGILGLVTAVGGLAAGYAAYNVVQQKLAEDEAKYNAELERTLKAQQALELATANAASGGGDKQPPLVKVDEEALKKLQEVKNAAAERVELARQALALEGLLGREAELQVVRNKAANDLRAAELELKGEGLEVTKAAIAEELKLAESTVLQRRTRELLQSNSDRVRAAADVLELVGLEGAALGRARAEQEAARAIIEARRTLTGEELRDRLQAVEAELALTLQAVELNDVLTQREAKQKAAAERTKKLLEEQARETARFEEQFLRTVSSGLEGVLRNGLNGFRDFTNAVKDLFLKLFADLLAANVFKRLTGALGSLVPGAGLQAQNIGNANVGAASGGLGTLAGAGLAGGAVGFGVGSLSTNRTLGTLGGAASGAATGAALGGPVGAVIGGVAGAIGGFFGAKKKAEEAAKALEEGRKRLFDALDSIRQELSGDKLAGALAQAKQQFADLRKQAEETFKGRKNEDERRKVLADINALEQRRLAQLREEAAEQARRAQEDFKVRELRAQGSTLEADALAFAQQQQREYADAVKEGANATTLAALSAAQAAEQMLFVQQQQKRAEEEARAAAAAVEERRRTVRTLELDTLAFSDPRGAARARELEDASNRVFDAIARGASEAELAALRLYNAAVLAAAEAARIEQDRRTSEGLVVRGLAASGNARAAEDARLSSGQRQELEDAIKNGFSDTNVALLQFVQFAEREQLRTQRAIEDGTKAIREAAANELAATDLLIEVTRSAAAAQVAAINAQIDAVNAQLAVQVKGFDGQIAAVREDLKLRTKALDEAGRVAREQLQLSQQQLQALEKQVQVSTEVVAALDKFTRDLLLGDFSPLSPEDQLGEARRQFEELADAARGGDAAAAQRLPEAANALLSASRSFNASNAGFVEDFNRVQDTIAAVRDAFGATLPVDLQQLEALRKQVTQQEQTLVAIDAQKQAVQEAAEQQLAVLEAAKAEAQENARKLVEALTNQRKTITADAEATVAKLEETKQAVQDAADRAIEQLIADENAKLATRLRENEFYDLFQSYAAGAGEYYTRALEQLDAPVALDGGEGGPGGSAGPSAGAQLQEQLVATVTELRNVNRTLQEELGTLRDRVERLTVVAVKANEAEVGATFRVVEAVNNVAVEVRAGAQLSAARGGGGDRVGIAAL
jgi:TP901 family phage tail tape measure protein